MGDLPPTEANDPQTRGLDRLSTAEIVATLDRAQRRAFDAVVAAEPQIAAAVDAIAARLGAGGSLHYVGAGTSGRLAMLDAAEAPPTFGTPPSLVRAHIAGGGAALVRAVEGAEDDASAVRKDLEGMFESGDAVIGISASGCARYVIAAMELARDVGALTIGITSNAGSPLATFEVAIVLDTGAEPLAGSTRLVAGTAQKLTLNAISTATMIRLNRIYDNLMVDVVATNDKLRDRAMRLVRDLTQVAEETARDALAAAEGSVKIAVVMLRRGVDAQRARALLAAYDGSLREALDSTD